MLNDYLPFLIIGCTTGAIYGICAMGLVLTYKTSGVFNIGHGAVCAVSAYLFYQLRQKEGLSWPLAGLIVIVGFGVVAGLILERLAFVLSSVPIGYKIVGTVGLLVAIQAAIGLIYGPLGLVFDPFLPQGEAVTIQGVAVTFSSLITLALGVGSAVGLYIFFRVSRLGVAMRAVVDNPELLDLTGESPTRIRRTAWIIGSTFAAVSGVLFAQTQAQLDINVLALLVVQAFGAATIGRFTSLPLSFVGGLVVGVAQALVGKETAKYASLGGLDLATPFIILFVGMLLIPRRKLVEVGAHAKSTALRPSRLHPAARGGALAALAVFLLTAPHLGIVGTHLPAYNQALTQVILFASLYLLVRTSGQMSLCHIAFAAIGACGFAHTLNDGVPFAIAVLLGGLLCIPLALVVAIPAIRVSGLFLALATLGFGLFVAQFGYGKDYLIGNGALVTRRPDGFTDDTSYYYVLLGVAVAVVLFVMLIERSRLGRLLRALGDSPVALMTHGLSVNISRVIVFCISCFLAGISGALYGSLFGSVTAETFNPINSLVVLAVLVISGRRMLVAVVVAPTLLYIVPNYVTGEDFNYALRMAFGVAAILAAANASGMLGEWGRSLLRRYRNSTAAARARSFDTSLSNPRTTRAGVRQVAPAAELPLSRRAVREVPLESLVGR